GELAEIHVRLGRNPVDRQPRRDVEAGPTHRWNAFHVALRPEVPHRGGPPGVPGGHHARPLALWCLAEATKGIHHDILALPIFELAAREHEERATGRALAWRATERAGVVG